MIMRSQLPTPAALLPGLALLVAILFAPATVPSAEVAELGLSLDSAKTKTPPPLAHSLLWKITRPDIAHASYLFGTVHFIPESRFFVPDRVREALLETDRIVFEFNMGDDDYLKNAASEMRLEKGTTLRGLYGEEHFASLGTFVQEEYGFDFAMFDGIKPFYLIANLSVTLVGEPVSSYERYFLDYANENGVAIGGLEDVQRQFDVVNRIPLDEQAEMLAELIEKPEEAKTMFARMYDMYEQQDLEGIHALFLESPEMEKYYEFLLVERNRAWISAIAKQHEDGRSFIACGAGHLAGEDGVIQLLRIAGFTVEPE